MPENNNNQFTYTPGHYEARKSDDKDIVETERKVWNRETRTLETTRRQFRVKSVNEDGSLELEKANETFLWSETKDGPKNTYVVYFVADKDPVSEEKK